jgi:hypothetical protein
MVLQLLINDTGHFFYDTEAGVQVGQAHRRKNGTWIVEVNDQWLKAPDLESAKRLFLEVYDRSPGLSLGAGEIDDSEFEIIDLTDE